MSKPVISVIVPCFNQAAYLPEALDSILLQTYQHWECIIVNDGSEDNTEAVAFDYLQRDKRFTYIKQQNNGVAAARNNGIKSATGTYILPVDADDYIHKEYISKAVALFLTDKNTLLVYCNVKKFGTENFIWSLPDFDYRKLLQGNMIHCSAMFKKDHFFLAGMYDETMKHGLEDWELWIRMLSESAQVKRINDAYLFYRTKEVSRNKMTVTTTEDIKYFIFVKHISLYKRYFKSPISIIEENDRLKSMYQNSFDYKLGNFIVNPFRKLIGLFKNER